MRNDHLGSVRQRQDLATDEREDEIEVIAHCDLHSAAGSVACGRAGPGRREPCDTGCQFIWVNRGIQLTPVNREPHGAGTRLENVANYLLYFQEVTHRLGGEEENSRVPLGWPPTSALPISQAVSASTRIQVESIEYPNGSIPPGAIFWT